MTAKTENVLVVGAGFAGLMVAWRASQHGRRVRLVAKGWGATHWHSGCIDILGYWGETPGKSSALVAHPAATVATLIAAQPQHPYAYVGLSRLQAMVEAVQALTTAVGYPMLGSLDKNWLLPSAVGTFRPTCLAPATMIAGDLSSQAPMLLVGFKQFTDFFANVPADNLSQQGIPARHITLDLPSLAQRHITTAVVLAQLMEQPAFQAELVQALKPQLGDAARVGFPAVLGLDRATAVHQSLQEQLGCPIFEIPGLPPSVPGMRLQRIFRAAIEKEGGQVYEGMEVIQHQATEERITAVFTEAAGRPQPHRAQQYVLATGGILGGGIQADHLGVVRELLFNLPLHAPENRLEWFQREFLDPSGHPIYRSGVMVNPQFQPVDADGRLPYANVWVAGTTLAHCDPIRERSFEGIALSTGFAVGEML